MILSEPPAVAGGFLAPRPKKTHPLPQVVLTCGQSDLGSAEGRHGYNTISLTSHRRPPYNLYYLTNQFVRAGSTSRNLMKRIVLSAVVVLSAVFFSTTSPKIEADGTYFNLAGGNYSQDWTNIGLITANDNWAGVASVEGFRGDGLAAAVPTDPQTIVADDSPGVLDVNANQTNPDTFTTGGVAEFHIANPAVALSGSGTAQAPYIKLYLNTAGRQNVQVSYNVRDLDASTDDAIQQVALQYRVGTSGNFTNLPAGFLADATTGPSIATLSTNVAVTLPAAANNQSQVQVRIISNNATGND